MIRGRRSLRPILGVAALLAAIPGMALLNRTSPGFAPVDGSESAEVERRIAEDFETPFAWTGVLVVSRLSVDPSSEPGRALIRRIVTPIEAIPGVRAVISPGTSLDTMLVGRDRRTAVVIVGLNRETDRVVDSLRSLSARLAGELRPDHPEVTLRWTGPAFLREDLQRAGASAARRAELLALPLTLLVAVWCFGTGRTVARAFLVVALTIATGMGLAGVLSLVMPVSPLVRTAVSIVAIALALDYVLLLTRGPLPAVTARRTVWIAAVAVAIGYAGLGLAPTGELRSAAWAGAGVSLLAALSALSLVPPLDAAPGPPSGRWLDWGRFVCRRPLLVLSLALPLPIVLAGAAMHTRLVTPLDRWLPASAESTVALADLEQAGRGAAVGMLRVLLIQPGADVLTGPGWEVLQTTGKRLAEVPGVASVRSLATVGTGELVVARHVLPDQVKAAYLSRDRSTAIVDLSPDPGLPRDSLSVLVQRIRAASRAVAAGPVAHRLVTGGLPAYALDYEQATRRVLPRIVGVIGLATFLVLVVAFRAPVVALKAVVLNLLVVSAAIGATTLVFQEGYGAAWMGHEAMGSILPTVPLLAFGLTFGLSMDYEIFLLSALRHARSTTSNESESIARAVATSGGVITRAGAIMGTLFLAVASSNLLPLAMLGFALTVAVVLDATIVRLALAPALLRLAGRWNWWPGWTGFSA